MSCKTLDVTAAPFSTSVLLEEKVRWPSQQCCVVTNCVFEPNTHPPCNFAVCRLSYGYLLSVRGKRDPDLNLSISMAAFTEFNLLLSLLSWFFSDSLSCCFQFGSHNSTICVPFRPIPSCTNTVRGVTCHQVWMCGHLWKLGGLQGHQ